jgi:hypothetical protein
MEKLALDFLAWYEGVPRTEPIPIKKMEIIFGK